jgi:hypothetical protein
MKKLLFITLFTMIASTSNASDLCSRVNNLETQANLPSAFHTELKRLLTAGLNASNLPNKAEIIKGLEKMTMEFAYPEENALEVMPVTSGKFQIVAADTSSFVGIRKVTSDFVLFAEEEKLAVDAQSEGCSTTLTLGELDSLDSDDDSIGIMDNTGKVIFLLDRKTAAFKDDQISITVKYTPMI